MASNSGSFSVTGVVLLLISLCLIVGFMYLLAINMKYIKELNYKIKIVMRAAFEKDSPLHKFKKNIEKSKLNDKSLENDFGQETYKGINPQEVLNILKKLAEKGRSARF